MERIVQKKVVITDGMHTGQIVNLEERDKPYKYIDIFIEIDGVEGVTLKYGCPDYLSKNAKLGKLLEKFIELKEGETVNLEKALVGRKISFMTLMEVTDRGEFARIVENSIKPLL